MAGNSWDIKTNDTRSEEAINLFIIFCEDDVSEPTYFNSFATEILRVSSIGNQKSGHQNLQATITKCMESGYMEFSVTEGYRLKNMVTEHLWCVYDRDLENTDLSQIDPQKSVGWSAAIVMANKAGLKVAWSNDAFELWILLHFETITPKQVRHRDYIYDRLTHIFKTLSSAAVPLKEFTGHKHFNYKGAFKRKSLFLEFVLPELKKRTGIAIERAMQLAAEYGENTEFHDQNPCTMVHLLVKDLLAYGGE